MTIYERIVNDIKEARRNSDKHRTVYLSTIMGEMDNEKSRRKSAEVTDDIAISILKSFHKNVSEVIELTFDQDIGHLIIERDIASSYLPTVYSEDELRSVIVQSGHKTIKDIMSYLKTEHANLYDGKMASTIAKEMV